jgi:hypothetical protein
MRLAFVGLLLAGAVFLAVSQGSKVVSRPKSSIPLVTGPANPVPPPATAPSAPPPVVVKDRPEYQGAELDGRKWEFCTVTAPIEATGDYYNIRPPADNQSAVEKAIYAARVNWFKPKELSFLSEMNKLGQAGWEPYGSFVFTPRAFQQPQSELGPHLAVMMKRRIR